MLLLILLSREKSNKQEKCTGSPQKDARFSIAEISVPRVSHCTQCLKFIFHVFPNLTSLLVIVKLKLT